MPIRARRRWKCDGRTATAPRLASGRAACRCRRPPRLSRNCARCWGRSAGVSYGEIEIPMATTANTLEFERPIAELEKQIEELKRISGGQQIEVTEEMAPLEKKL